MALPDPPRYTVSQLEARAAEILAARFGHDLPIPIDIDLLLEEREGVTLDYMRGLRAEQGLDGMILKVVATGEFEIYIDEELASKQPNRYRSTVAEEYAHLVLHKPLLEHIVDIASFRELQLHPQCANIERNAKRFAAAILMPATAVQQHACSIYTRLVGVAGYGDAEAVYKQMAAILAAVFTMSVESMRYRLKEWPMQVYKRVVASVNERLPVLISASV
jgi:Zn-dependent peptidase ImmA (M78 family)